jgi:hypothetical protein
MEESSWVRSVYLYLMCVVSIALIAAGAVGTVVGAVHTISPDLGHRDTLDRVGIGISNVATKVVDLINESQASDIEDFCRNVTDTDSDFDDCVDDETGGGAQMAAIQDGIEEVRSELQSQIRNNSVDRVIRGVLMIGVGFVLFRIHGKRTDLFADGLFPKRASAADATSANESESPPAVSMQ